MGRKAGRSPEETRRLILGAGSAVIRAKGLSARLDDIAVEAGVSKGGLVYHFASKDELLRALAHDLNDGFRRAVLAALDPEDTAPGRLTRAYVRASMDTGEDVTATRERLMLTAQLVTVPDLAEIAREDAERWEHDLRADGLPEDVLTLVVAAADGASTAPLWGADTRTPAYDRLEERLLAMTYAAEDRAEDAAARAGG